MSQRRLAAAVLAVTGAVLMPVSLFLDWFRVNTGDSEFDVTGWNAFEIADLALVATAVIALVCVARLGRQAPDTSARTLLLAGAITVAIVVVQLIDKPPLLGFGLHVSLRLGAGLGLAGAILVLLGGALLAQGRPAAPEP